MAGRVAETARGWAVAMVAKAARGDWGAGPGAVVVDSDSEAAEEVGDPVADSETAAERSARAAAA